MSKSSFFPKKFDFAHFAKTGALFLGIIGLITAGILSSLSADNRQQAAGSIGINTYDKCDYGKNNGKPVCLDSEYGMGNCAVCINGEKHIVADSECAPNLCSAPHGPTCDDGHAIYQEGGTSCKSEVECVMCTDGHWVTTDRWNCSGPCTVAKPIDYGACDPTNDRMDTCGTNRETVLRCNRKTKKWEVYRTCGSSGRCDYPGGVATCLSNVNTGEKCNPKTSNKRCSADLKSILQCDRKTRTWKVIDSCPGYSECDEQNYECGKG